MGDYRISDAEWNIMRILWEESPLTATQIIEALKDSTDWKPKTIHTLISRLVKKNVLGINKDSKQYEFYPIVKREECIQEETESFIEKIYQGSFYNLVSNFIKNEHISQQEIEELKNLLNERIQKGDENDKSH